MLDDLLDFGMSFDFFTPIIHALDGMTNIFVNVPGWTCAEVAKYLNKHGIRTGLGMNVNGEWILPVDNPERAKRLLANLSGAEQAPMSAEPQGKLGAVHTQNKSPFSIFSEVFGD